MTEPPPYWLIGPFAVVAGWHGLRDFNLRTTTHGLIGGWTPKLILIAYVPAAIAMLNGEALTFLVPVIEWARHYVLALLVVAAIASEFVLRQTVRFGANRLVKKVAKTNDFRTPLAYVCDALQAIRCHDAAIVVLRKLIKTETDAKDLAAAWTSLAGLCGIHRRFLDAEAAARKAIELDPDNRMAYYYLGTAMHEQGREQEFVANLKEAERRGLDLSPLVQFKRRDPGRS